MALRVPLSGRERGNMSDERLKAIAADAAFLRGCGSVRILLPLDEVEQLVAEVRRLRAVVPSGGGR
jgi:HAMP domain-containing protein